MIETIITVAIVLAAILWFYRWVRSTASGKKGCACGGCSKECASRAAASAGVEDNA